MSQEIGNIRVSRTNDGIRIDISGDLSQGCCCCCGSGSEEKCDCDCGTDSKAEPKKS